MRNPYEVLGVNSSATLKEIRSAYRNLVKKHHPDAGGDKQQIIDINAAWEILRDKENRQSYDRKISFSEWNIKDIKYRDKEIKEASDFIKSMKDKVILEEGELIKWIKTIYSPIDKSIGQIINSLPSKIRELSADPYEDILMESFCKYLNISKNKIKKVNKLYSSVSAPKSATTLALNLYHCFSKVEDALNEFDLYTKGYVDDYLHDGNEMLRDAKRKRKELKEQRKKLPIY